jgi:glycosyltransferase involved in cell wall biosynthesis
MIELLCLGVGVGIIFFLWKSRLSFLRLGRLPASDSRAPLDLTVIIPARNEAHQITNAIQSFAGSPVIVVDDASGDNTAAVAEAAGARVITAPALLPGRLGKPTACAAGAAQAKTKWILFVDADTTFHASFARSAVHYAEQNQYDLLTAFVEQRCVTLFEKILLPYSFALYFTGVRAAAVNRSGHSYALANGQCLLFRRSAYEQIGGHLQVDSSVIEDVAIAQLAKRRHLSVRVLRAEHLGSVRMYDGLKSIWRGFQKNSFRFLQADPFGGMQVILASILLTSWLPVVIIGFGSRRSLHLSLSLLLVAPFAGLFPWYAESRAGRMWRTLLAPIAIYGFQLIALNGMFVTLLRRTTDWKGRRV